MPYLASPIAVSLHTLTQQQGLRVLLIELLLDGSDLSICRLEAVRHVLTVDTLPEALIAAIISYSVISHFRDDERQ